MKKGESAMLSPSGLRVMRVNAGIYGWKNDTGVINLFSWLIR